MERTSSSEQCARAEDYDEFADSIRDSLAPADRLERVVAERVISAAWRLDRSVQVEMEVDADLAERSLFRSIRLLNHLRRRPPRGESATADPPEASIAWRDRLSFDPAVSRESPVICGTWVTVAQIVSLIVVDGWTWHDVLRTHPELTEDDLRACLSFAVESV